MIHFDDPDAEPRPVQLRARTEGSAAATVHDPEKTQEFCRYSARSASTGWSLDAFTAG